MSSRGGKHKLYYAAGVSWDCTTFNDVPASPTWTLIERVIDVNLGRSKGSSDGSSRESDYESIISGLKKVELTFGYRIYKQGATADPVRTVLTDSFNNDKGILFAVMDGDIAVANSRGLMFVGEVLSMPEGQPLTDAAVLDLTVVRHPARTDAGALINPSELVTT